MSKQQQNGFQRVLQGVADTAHTVDAYKQAALAVGRQLFLPGSTVTKVAPSVEESLRFAASNAERRGRNYIRRGTDNKTDYQNGLTRNVNAYNIIGAANFERVTQNGEDYYRVKDRFNFKDYDKQGKQIPNSGSSSHGQWEAGNKLMQEGFSSPTKLLPKTLQAVPRYVESLMAKREELLGSDKDAVKYDLMIPVKPPKTGNSDMYKTLGLIPPAGSLNSEGFTQPNNIGQRIANKSTPQNKSTPRVNPTEHSTAYIPIPKDTYTVKAGDNLTTISRNLGVDMNELAKQNNIRNVNQINVGQTLNYNDPVKKAQRDGLNAFLGKKLPAKG